MKRWPPHPVRTLLASASLRVRVMAAAAILVTVTSAVMGLLGTTLLRGYLINRIDTQLHNFGVDNLQQEAGGQLRPVGPGP